MADIYERLFDVQDRYMKLLNIEDIPDEDEDFSGDEPLTLISLFQNTDPEDIPKPHPEWLEHSKNIIYTEIDNPTWQDEIEPTVTYTRMSNQDRRYRVHSSRQIFNGIVWIFCTTTTSDNYPELPEAYPPLELCVQRHQEWLQRNDYRQALQNRVRDLLEKPSLDRLMSTDYQSLSDVILPANR